MREIKFRGLTKEAILKLFTDEKKARIKYQEIIFELCRNIDAACHSIAPVDYDDVVHVVEKALEIARQHGLCQALKGEYMNHIEDADILVDLTGGREAIKKYKERISQLKDENAKLKKQQLPLKVIAKDRLKMLTESGYYSGCGVGYIKQALKGQQ